MDRSDLTRAIAAATSVAASLGLPADDAVVLQNSNKLALRLTPREVFARIAPVGQEVAELEVELARRLAAAGPPVCPLEPRADPRVYTRDGFAVTLWTYYEPVTPAVCLSAFKTFETVETVESPGHHVECRPRGTLAQQAQELLPEPSPAWELVATVPTPRRDHREHELSAFVQQCGVDARVVFADRLGGVGEIELDGTAAARLEIDEQQAVARAQHVARMRLAVEELLRRAAFPDRPSQAGQSAAEEGAVRFGELR